VSRRRLVETRSEVESANSKTPQWCRNGIKWR
jgi:hypothetical protein